MTRDSLRPVGYVVAVLAGLPASFVVGAAVFGDGAPLLGAERLVPVIVTYLVLAAIGSLAFRLVWSKAATWWLLGVCISSAAFPIIALFGGDLGLPLQSLYFLVTLTSACLGATVGMVRRRSRARERKLA